MERMKLYEQLVNMAGIAGHESEIKKFVRAELQKVSDEIIQDKLGSVFGVSKGNGPVIMIAGHMDEVGAMVTKITDEGFIKMLAIGGINPEVYLSQNMEIIISPTKRIKGIIGAVPPHINRGSEDSKPELKFEDLLLDIGADSKEAAIQMGVKVGQQVVSLNQYYVMEDQNKIVSKAWDNRFGVGMAIEVLRAIHHTNHPNTVIAGATVQEEVGLRGATTASNMVQPDLFLAIDVSPVGDFLPKDHPRAYGKLGGGFLVRFYDPRCIMHLGVKKYIEDLANERQIKYQHFLSMGGTDAAAAQYNHAIATTIGLPGRYIHTNAAVIDVRDVEEVKKMLLAIIETFDADKLAEVKANG
ncbi:MAG: peptidase M28 [Bacilli bacterium]|jgi:putative aminopeptidase FrvX|nr:peptidase M28 [Bacilli bacterium]